MYDIEIVVPVSYTGKYANRFEDFKRYGFTNIGDCKVIVHALVGMEDFPNFQDGWLVDAIQVSSGVSHCASKVYDYYSKIDDFNRAKWFMRCDDDSLTNISGLYDFLSNFDCEDSYYFCGDRTIGDNRVDLALAKKLGLKIIDQFHEVEVCIASRGLVRKILSNEPTKNFIKERAKIENGYTDITFAYAAQMVGVVPTEISCLTSRNELNDFFLGKKFHIHAVAMDINSYLYEIIKSTANYKNVKFAKKPLIYSSRPQEDGMFDFLRSVKLSPIGGLTFKDHIEQERYWSYNFDTKILRFYNQTFVTIAEFLNVENEEITKITGSQTLYNLKLRQFLPPREVFLFDGNLLEC